MGPKQNRVFHNIERAPLLLPSVAAGDDGGFRAAPLQVLATVQVVLAHTGQFEEARGTRTEIWLPNASATPG